MSRRPSACTRRCQVSTAGAVTHTAPPNPMRTALISCLLPALALLAGCGTQRDEVPGNVRPGSIEEVTGRVDGFGNGSADGRGGGQLEQIGVVPITGNVKPVIPLVKPPEVISFYVFPRKSRDGMSFRDGVWIHRVIRPFAWGVDEAMRNDRLKLSSLTNLRLDDNGQLVIDQEKTIEPPTSDVQGLRDMAQHLPWRATDGGQPLSRTTVVFPNSGQAVTSTAPADRAPAVVGPNGSVNMQEIERAMAEAQQRVRETQQRQRSGSSAAAIPPATPTK